MIALLKWYNLAVVKTANGKSYEALIGAMSSKKALLIIVFLSACAYIFLFPFESFRVGGEFIAQSRFERYADKEGYIIVDSYNVSWPATIVAVHEGVNELSLDTAPGMPPIRISGYEGYRLMGLVLKKKDITYAGIVLRSKERVADNGDTVSTPIAP